MNIRQEIQDDYAVTENLIQEAFLNAEFSNHKEHILVHKLRYTEAFVPQLSLIAELDNHIAGHILFTKVKIEGRITKDSLVLAPLSVLPKVQRQGIGSRLLKYGMEKAKELGFESVIVLGHPQYYKKFGFMNASRWNVKCPFDVPDDVFMALELKRYALNDAAGIVRYPSVFTE